jgi:hypothetical protein
VKRGVLRHVHFEDPAAFEEPHKRAGYEVQYHDIGRHSFPDRIAPALVIVLGAPVGVYEDDKNLFLRDEIRSSGESSSKDKEQPSHLLNDRFGSFSTFRKRAELVRCNSTIGSAERPQTLLRCATSCRW